MGDVEMVAIHSVVESLPYFSHLLETAPPWMFSGGKPEPIILQMFPIIVFGKFSKITDYFKSFPMNSLRQCLSL